ncbi:radical SAM protein [candidate division KSB1 bacterium]|nr:radical SAM protein [candidate division KSB1 bacterium]
MAAHCPQVTEIEAKSILRKQKKVESWFVSRYGMNLYRGCSHNCAYCDGRAEKYQVEGEFGRDVAVKKNAIEVLQRELDPQRRRKPLKRGFVFVGGGVCDSYQAIELRYESTRQALELIARYDLPVHMLTKSTQIERDFELLRRIHDRSRAIISMSFSSADDAISAHFEPGASRPSHRLKTLAKFKKAGFPIGMYLMPALPFITDSPAKIAETVQSAKDIGIDFIIFGGLTLKAGRQQHHFYAVLRDYDASLIPKYEDIYSSNPWGEARKDYYYSIQNTFAEIASSLQIPVRIPPFIWHDFVDETDRVVIILEHIDYLLKLKKRTSSYGYAVYSISQVQEPLQNVRQQLHNMKGIGPSTARLICEILDTGSSAFYEWLLLGKKPLQK